MSPRSLPFPGMAQLVTLTVLVAALLGLFAMHGLAAHATAHASSAGGWPTDEINLAASHGAQGDPSTASAERGSGAVEGRDGQGGDDSSLIELCVAVLTAALIGVLGQYAQGPANRLRLATGARCALPPASARRDRDPPCLHSLSIQRC